jgi:NADH:ubiquinone oxidoreductase subunit K
MFGSPINAAESSIGTKILNIIYKKAQNLNISLNFTKNYSKNL